MAQPPTHDDPLDAHEPNRRDFLLMTAAASLAASGPTAAHAAPSPVSQELAKLTIADASQKIHAGALTSTDLVRACIERSRVYNAKVNAYITLMEEPAL